MALSIISYKGERQMKMRKFLALMLVFAMMFTVFALTSCGDDEDDGGDSEASERDLANVFGGEVRIIKGKFNVLTETDRSVGQAFNIVDLTADKNLGAEEIKAAVELRNDLILRNFRANITRTPSAQASTDALQAARVGNDDYNAFMLAVAAGLSFASQGYAVNFSEADYIDLTESYWDQGTRETLQLAGGNYIAIGDLLTVDKDATYITMFNKKVLSLRNAGFDDKDLYNLVEAGVGKNGGFTLDWLMTEVKDLYSPANTDQEKQFWTDTPTNVSYGLFTQQEVVNILLQTSGFTPTKVDSSQLSGVVVNLNANVEGIRFDDAVRKLWQNFGAVAHQPYFMDLNTICTTANAGGEDPWQLIARGGFSDNRAAFFICHAGSIALLRDMESEFGILPIPKLYDWQTDYKSSIQYGNAHCYVVPQFSDRFIADSCYILEAMCYYSSEDYLEEDSLKYAYYDKLLTGKAIRDPQSWKMLDIIFGPEGRVYDLSMALNINRIYSVLPNSVCTATYSWGSQKASIEQGFSAAIGDSLKQLLDVISGGR